MNAENEAVQSTKTAGVHPNTGARSDHDGIASLVELQKPRLADWAYGEIRRYIVEGVLPPGTRLVEKKLTTSLGISRTPLREALRRLEQDGLIERHISGGLSVTELTPDEIKEIMGIRAVLEGHCAALAAERISADELAKLFQAHEDAVDAIRDEDLQALKEANTRFHDGINTASGSRQCLAMVNGIRESILRYRSEALNDEATRRRSFEEHLEILTAIKEHDAERAEKLMRAHIGEVARHLTAVRRAHQ
jgi:DNA-binding GntR family transcriptional regulator